jgi:hypothetical protein
VKQLVAALAACLALTSTLADAAPTPAPKASARAGDLAKYRPTTAQHTEFTLEVNAKGQVSKVDSAHASKDRVFNTMTYGNVIQTFIRTPDGHAVSGLYRMSYDYDPKTQKIRRTVSLIHAGGVDPKAPGAVVKMAQINLQNARLIQKSLQAQAKAVAAAKAAAAKAAAAKAHPLQAKPSPSPSPHS